MNISSEGKLRQEITRVCRRLYERGLIAGAEGNVSVRLADGQILITPSGVPKVDVSPSDLVIVEPRDGRVAGPGRASSELGMHLRIYESRADVGAVVHAHPPLATAFGVAGEDLMAPVLPEIVILTGGVPLVPYATPGSAALADAIEPFLEQHDAFLMANHGATSIGSTLSSAHARMESVEHAARTLLAARMLGRITTLSATQYDELLAMRARSSGDSHRHGRV